MPGASPPLFIIGNPRSGTTLLRLMLTCHRRIVIPPECGFAVWYRERYEGWPDLCRREPDLLARFADDVLAARKFETWGLSREVLLASLAPRRPASYPEAVEAVYLLYAARVKPAAARWGDKNNFHIDHIPEIDRMFPEARFLHIVRDGRSVACSYRALHGRHLDSRYAPKLPREVDVIAHEWGCNVEKVRRAFASLAPGRTMEIRFEDLVTDPEGRLRDVCDYLGEDFDPEMLRYYELNRSRVLEPREFWSWKEKNLSPPMPEEVDRYRRDLSESEIARFNSIAGQTLARYGYAL